MPKIIQIQPEIPSLPTKKRVAAYARISLERGRLIHSLSAQVSHYSAYIQSRTEWEYVGVYADSGESGTGKNREEFRRLIADCEAGKIDVVLTKSISRFARNTIDLLEVVRRLRELGIEVRFEEQGINTLSGDGELMLTILASFAREESRSLSENVKWKIRKDFKEGIPNSFNVYGYRWDWSEEKFVVHPEESEVVRMIFSDYVGGSSTGTIEKKLNLLGCKTLRGNNFTRGCIRRILANNKYVGDLEMQKSYIENHITHKVRKNNGELPRYMVTDAHEAIVSREIFAQAQAELKKRGIGGYRANPGINSAIFSKRIKCGICGAVFHQASRKRADGSKFRSWKCYRHQYKGKAFCPMREVPDDKLRTAAAEILGLDEFDEDAFNTHISNIVIPEQFIIVFHLLDGTTITKHWEISRNKSVQRKGESE